MTSPLLEAPADQGPRCAIHPAVAANCRCDQCGVLLCSTCAFELPGPMHLCPTCAVSSRETMSPRRRRALMWGFIFAAVGTLGVAGTVVFGVSAPDTEAGWQLVGMGILLFSLGPGIAGLSMCVGAMHPQLRTPFSLWIATVWNGLLIALFGVLMILGLISD